MDETSDCLVENLHTEESVSTESDVEVTFVNEGTSWYLSVLIIVNAGLGAGLLAFPKAYDKAGGVAIGLTFQLILATAAYGSLLILAHCADKRQTSSYQDTVDTLCGKWMKIICSAVIALYSFGTCITFLIIIGDQLDRALYYITNDAHFDQRWYFNRKFTISASSIILILPLCMPKRIDFLRYPSAIGVIGVLYIGLLIIVEYFVSTIPPGPIKSSPDTWTDVFFVIPVICFGYQCHLSAVPVYGCMRGRPSLRLFALTAGLAMLTSVLAYISTGVFGYYTFGSHVSADVLVDYAPTPQILVGLILLAVKTYTTYPILFFCGRLALETCFADVVKWSHERLERREKHRRIGIALVWFFTTLLLSVFVPNIELVISLLGGIAALFLFVFPGLCLYNLCLTEHPVDRNASQWFTLIVAGIYITFGGFIFALTTTQSIMNAMVTLGSSTNTHKKTASLTLSHLFDDI